MAWKLDNGSPVYLQLMAMIEDAVINKKYAPGEKIPPVRELAAEAGVNPNTMQKALAELERSGVLRSERTAGRFVTDDCELLVQRRKELVVNNTRKYLAQLREWGVSVEEIHDCIEKEWKDGNS